MRGGCDELNTNSCGIFYHNDNHIFAEPREYCYCLSLVFNIVLICLFGMGEKMTKSFDEWYREAKKLNNDGFSAKDFFEAGQQSKQAEVDELQKRIDEAMKMLAHGEGYGYEQCARLAINILKGDSHES